MQIEKYLALGWGIFLLNSETFQFRGSKIYSNNKMNFYVIQKQKLRIKT